MALTPVSKADGTRAGVLAPYALLSLAAFFWATNWVVGRAMRDVMPPVSMGFWRWVIALGILLPFAATELRQKWPLVRDNWLILSLLGAMGVAGYNTLVYVGLQHTPAANAVLFNSISPILIILLSWGVFGDRPKPKQAVGVVVSFLGILAIITRGDLAVIAALRSHPGDLWLLLAMMLWAIYTVILRWRPSGLSPVAFLAAIALFGLPVLLPFFLWEYSVRGGVEVTRTTLATLAYYGIFPSVLAYLFWHYGVARVGAHTAGLFTHLVPAFGALLAVIFLDERLERYHFVGIVLIFSGLYLSRDKVQRAYGRP